MMHISFRRDDGRVFVFEMPDARDVIRDGRAMLDQFGYKAISKRQFVLISTFEISDDSPRHGDAGILLDLPGDVPFRCAITNVVAVIRPPVEQFTFTGKLQRFIPTEEIREWLNP